MTYLAVSAEGTAERSIRKSRFLGFAFGVRSAQEAEARIEALRARYSDAAHVCYAYVSDALGNEMRFSDDGEPKGTAGLPMLDLIRNETLRYTAVAVVRYFGGVKLGTGGLLRAYTETAAAALDAARIRAFDRFGIYEWTADYETAAKVRVAGELERAYGDEVNVTFAAADERELADRIAAELGALPKLKFTGERDLPIDKDGKPVWN